MKPGEQNNYFGKNAEETDVDKITEVYAPDQDEQITDEPEIAEDSAEPEVDDEIIHWSAPEFIQKEKGGFWFFLLILAALAFVAVAITATKTEKV